MYSARDQRDNREWLARIDAAADGLELGSEARSYASDMFLTQLPDEERSKQAVAAASLYAGALIAGEERSQTAVAESMDVSRLSIQQRWKDLLREADREEAEGEAEEADAGREERPVDETRRATRGEAGSGGTSREPRGE